MTNTPTQAAIEAAARALLASESASGLEWEKLDSITRGSFKRDAQAAIEAYRTAMREAGWVMVPVEPSEAQVDAGMDAYGNDESTSCIYRAMIAARPQIGGE